jgi:hypothetical protein
VSEVSDETSEEEVSEVEEPPRYDETGPQQISLF